MKTKKLVIIDDDPRYLELIAAALGSEFEVSCAADGLEGLKACREGAPDVVLLDLRMPRVNGLQVLRAMAVDAATRAVPVVVFSASYLDASVHAELGTHANVFRLLDKLAPLGRVREAVREACAA